LPSPIRSSTSISPVMSCSCRKAFVDITGVFERKLKAMEAMEAQKYMHKHYAERAEHRAFHARYATGDGEVRYAEAFQRAIPQVVRSL
jgi:4-oxalomesaconate hydratase